MSRPSPRCVKDHLFEARIHMEIVLTLFTISKFIKTLPFQIYILSIKFCRICWNLAQSYSYCTHTRHTLIQLHVGNGIDLGWATPNRVPIAYSGCYVLWKLKLNVPGLQRIAYYWRHRYHNDSLNWSRDLAGLIDDLDRLARAAVDGGSHACGLHVSSPFPLPPGKGVNTWGCKVVRGEG